MTPVAKRLRAFAEKLFGTYYEGEEPPARLREIAIDFANRHPAATREEWVTFAAEHAAEAWRCGFRRGFEFVQRDPRPFPDVDAAADALDPNWRWAPEISLEDPDAVVLHAESADAGMLEEQLRRLVGNGR